MCGGAGRGKKDDLGGTSRETYKSVWEVGMGVDGRCGKKGREGCGSVVDGRLPQQGWYG